MNYYITVKRNSDKTTVITFETSEITSIFHLIEIEDVINALKEVVKVRRKG